MGRSDAFGSTFHLQKRKLLREPIFPNTTKNRVQINNIFREAKNSIALFGSQDKLDSPKKSEGGVDGMNIDS